MCGFYLQVKFATSLLASLAGGKLVLQPAVCKLYMLYSRVGTLSHIFVSCATIGEIMISIAFAEKMAWSIFEMASMPFTCNGLMLSCVNQP